MGLISGQFLPDPAPAYAFSKPLDWLGCDPSYPTNPSTLGEYIRKWRMEQGISQASLAEKLGVNKMTIVNWEIKGMVPRIKNLREKLIHEVEGAGRFLL
jgi:DNA-binding XRE family transcriptional regulator